MGADRLFVRLYAVHRDDLEPVRHFHVMRVVIDGIADGRGRVIVGGNHFN